MMQPVVKFYKPSAMLEFLNSMLSNYVFSTKWPSPLIRPNTSLPVPSCSIQTVHLGPSNCACRVQGVVLDVYLVCPLEQWLHQHILLVGLHQPSIMNYLFHRHCNFGIQLATVSICAYSNEHAGDNFEFGYSNGFNTFTSFCSD